MEFDPKGLPRRVRVTLQHVSEQSCSELAAHDAVIQGEGYIDSGGDFDSIEVPAAPDSGGKWILRFSYWPGDHCDGDHEFERDPTQTGLTPPLGIYYRSDGTTVSEANGKAVVTDVSGE